MGWFRSSNLKRENVVLWILWALFSTETCKPEWEEEINEYLLDIESILGSKLDGGYNDTTKSMRVTFDPVVSLHRPLLWYTVSMMTFFVEVSPFIDVFPFRSRSLAA